ncbi:MAG: prepilin-type N-terminal cleavage/methylation domain-containing protein [bacterium]|nr:prepilin-type N-terminal cleavage/methylation domain-containing protein [bacterium]
MKMRSNRRGFTIVELLVAVSILTVLSTIAIASYGSATKRSRDSKRRADIEQLRSALEMYRADFGFYPSTGGGVWTPASNLALPSYIAAIPTDPNAEAFYEYKATNVTSSQFYGYCLSALLEVVGDPLDNTCTPDVSLDPPHNFGVRHP